MEQDKSAGVLHSQRALAEVTEMLRISHLVHQGLVNLQPLIQSGSDLQTQGDMTFGNKIALLSGDYLLGNSCAELAGLRNQEIVELISSAVRDLAEAEFIGDRDEQNVPLPAKPTPEQRFDEDYLAIDAADNLKPLSLKGIKGDPEKEWTVRHILSAGRLLGKSCQGALKLAGLHDATQRQGYLFGRHLALAWQACIDLEAFQSNEFPGGSFSLVSAPVIYQLEYNPLLYSEIAKGLSSVDNIDYAKIFYEVINGPGIEKTRNLHTKHSIAAMNVLNELPSSDARTALQNIILAMQDL
jgi:decaprenyl-diphosphate synthase subunit 2